MHKRRCIKGLDAASEWGWEVYYLRSVEDCESHAPVRRRPHGARRGVVVEYMDRARGPTQDFLSQTSRGTPHLHRQLATFSYLPGNYRDEHSAS